MRAGRHCRDGRWESRENEGEVWGCDSHLAIEPEGRVVWSTGWRSAYIAWGKDCWTLLWHPFSFSLFVIKQKKKKNPPEFQVIIWLSSPDLAVALFLMKRIIYKRGKERGMKCQRERSKPGSRPRGSSGIRGQGQIRISMLKALECLSITPEVSFFVKWTQWKSHSQPLTTLYSLSPRTVGKA